MQAIESNCIAASYFGTHLNFRASLCVALHDIFVREILPNLDAAQTNLALRSILSDIETVKDITQIAARIVAIEDRLPVIIDELAHQACAAGIRWEQDESDFFEVTERIGRLKMIAYHLSAMLERSSIPTGQSILLMPCPQETHVFGLQLLGMTFREAGWAVTRPEMNSEWPGEQLTRLHYDVVGLTLSNVGLLPLLRNEIPRLRRASRNQSLRVLVGGPCFDLGEADFRSVGADAYAPDACSAPAIADEIVNEQKLICA
ncbi:hypothetical protein [Methylobacterium sp. GXS13]|uniref:cobalamin B12-binding domain-containing protein n=1 Tax=Methylobacterium sp. GXS13 TaxID=1730094 RepID=UPI000AD0894F|nr:hypothetical protein [Methylobacterium sp. GXS13]